MARKKTKKPTVASQAKAAATSSIKAQLLGLEKRLNDEVTKADAFLASIQQEKAAATAKAEANILAAKQSKMEAEQALVEAAANAPWRKEVATLNIEPAINTVAKPVVTTTPGDLAAIAVLRAVGVEGLVDVMASIRKMYPDISSEDALMLAKFDPRFNAPYMNRFSGNQLRMQKGLAPLDDKEYLANEAAYEKVFKAYGIPKFANRAKYAELIGANKDPVEVGEVVAMGYSRIVKGASQTREALRQLHPEITDGDILAYAIDPVNELPVIQRKIQAAEIGGAALAQNLSIGLTQAPTAPSGYTNVERKGLTVDELVSQGVTLEEARKGYAAVAEVLPTAEKLSAIYGSTLEQYGRQQAEQEEFKGLASAKRARERLTEAELRAFQGESGRTRTTLARPEFI